MWKANLIFASILKRKFFDLKPILPPKNIPNSCFWGSVFSMLLQLGESVISNNPLSKMLEFSSSGGSFFHRFGHLFHDDYLEGF